MNIKIQLKQLGRRKIQQIDYVLQKDPATLREMIDLIARGEAQRYNARLQNKDNVSPIPEDLLRGMLNIGKVSFGEIHSDRHADPEAASQTAIMAFEDGLVRIFRNGAELTGLDDPLMLQENDTLTFLRLTMLTGSLL